MTGRLIRSRMLVTRWGAGHQAIEGGALYVEAGVVREVGPYAELHARHPAAEEIGDGTHLVIPGFVNAHTHGRGITTLRQHIPDDPGEVRSVGLHVGLSGDPYWDVLYTCARQLEGGITATMHLDTNYGYGPVERLEARLQDLLAGYRDSGMRSGLAIPFRDAALGGPAADEELLAGLDEEARDEVAAWPRATIGLDEYFALHERLATSFPDTVLQFEPVTHAASAPEYLTAVRQCAASKKLRLQLHLLETAYQKEFSLRKFGITNVERLAAMGFLDGEVSCAHCVWFTERDIAIVREVGAKVVHLPSANLRLRSGLAPIKRMVDAGITVALGTDNLAINDGEDIVQEIRLAQVLHSPPGIGEAPVEPHAALAWATRAAAQVLGIPGIGALDPGCQADVVLLNMRSIERALLEHGHDIAACVLQWIRQPDIDQVLVGGEVRVRGGRYVFRDREEVERKAYEGQRQWRMTPTVSALRSRIAERYASQEIGGEPYYPLQSRNAETNKRRERQ